MIVVPVVVDELADGHAAGGDAAHDVDRRRGHQGRGTEAGHDGVVAGPAVVALGDVVGDRETAEHDADGAERLADGARACARARHPRPATA